MRRLPFVDSHVTASYAEVGLDYFASPFFPPYPTQCGPSHPEASITDSRDSTSSRFSSGKRTMSLMTKRPSSCTTTATTCQIHGFEADPQVSLTCTRKEPSFSDCIFSMSKVLGETLSFPPVKSPNSSHSICGLSLGFSCCR